MAYHFGVKPHGRSASSPPWPAHSLRAVVWADPQVGPAATAWLESLPCHPNGSPLPYEQHFCFLLQMVKSLAFIQNKVCLSPSLRHGQARKSAETSKKRAALRERSLLRKINHVCFQSPKSVFSVSRVAFYLSSTIVPPGEPGHSVSSHPKPGPAVTPQAPSAGSTLGFSLCTVKAWYTLKSCVNVNPLAALLSKTEIQVSEILLMESHSSCKKHPEQLPF